MREREGWLAPSLTGNTCKTLSFKTHNAGESKFAERFVLIVFMRHFIPLLCVSAGFSANLCAVSHASPSDYAYGSMARSNEVSRENSFSRYMSSSSNYNIDSDAL